MKATTNPFRRAALLAVALGITAAAQATTFYWDGFYNAAWSSTKWNTTSGGTGMNWVNGTTNDAVVNNGYVYANSLITANTLTIGDGVGVAGSAEAKSSFNNGFWNIGSITINSDGLLSGGGNTTTHLRQITLNGGTIGGGDNGGDAATYGVFNFDDTIHVTANSTITTGGAGATLGQSGGTQFNVDNGKTLSVTGLIVKKASSSDTGLIKTGDGTMTLSGANTYTGATNVDEGTLQVSGSIANSVVTVSHSGTVLASGATGTIGKGVTVNIGAILAAGGQGSVGTATVGSDGLSFGNGSIFEWDINANSTSSGFDKVTVGGTVSVGTGAEFKINLGSSIFASGDFTDAVFWKTPHGTQTWNMSDIFSKAFSSGAFANVTTVQDVTSYGSFTINGTTLTWTAVPEPTSALAGLLITAGLLRRRRAVG